jgi:hypothetical protein
MLTRGAVSLQGDLRFMPINPASIKDDAAIHIVADRRVVGDENRGPAFFLVAQSSQ